MLEEAKSQLQIAMSLDDKCFEVAFAYASVLLSTGDSKTAYKIAEQLFEVYPQNVEVLTLCAESAFAENDLNGAETYISLALQREPDNLDLVLFRAKVLFQKGEYLSVSSLLDAYGRINKTNKDYLLLRAELQLSWNRNSTAAAATIQDALTRYPTDPEVILFAAEIASDSDIKINSKSAFELISLLLEQNPNNIDALRIFVKEKVKQREWEDA